MTRQIHGIVKNSHDFDHIVRRSPIKDKMPTRTTSSSDMIAAKARLYLVASGTAWNIWAISESCDGF